MDQGRTLLYYIKHFINFMKRAISPVVGILILSLLVVAFGISAFLFITHLQSSVQSATQEQTERIIYTTGSRFSILETFANIDPDLVLGMNFEDWYFTCDNIMCNVTFKDVSNYHNDGIFYGNLKGEIYKGTKGDYRWEDKGLYVNFLEDGCIKISNSLAAFNGSKTIIVILKPIQLENNCSTIVTTTDTSWGTEGYSLAITQDHRIQFKIGDGGNKEVLVSSSKIILNKTNFIAAVYNSSSNCIIFYINGKAENPHCFTKVKGYPSQVYLYIGGEDCSGNECGIKAIFYELLIYNKPLSDEEIKACYQDIRNCPRDDSLVLHLSFDEGKGKYVNDLSFIKKGPWGYYLQFNNTPIGSYILIKDSPSIDNIKELGISFWLKPNNNPNCDSKNNWRSIMHKGSTAGTSTGFSVVLEEFGIVGFSVGNGTNTERRWTYAIPFSKWTHLAAIYSSQDWELKPFKDGQYSLGASWGDIRGYIKDNDKDLYINHPNKAICPIGNGWANISIDEIYLFKRALSQEEVKLLYANYSIFYPIRVTISNTGTTAINLKDIYVKILDSSGRILCSKEDLYANVSKNILRPGEVIEITYYPSLWCFNKMYNVYGKIIEMCLPNGFCDRKRLD